jgi:hypothetical protein
MDTHDRPKSPALARYNALRDQGASPEDASAAVVSEFPDLETMHPEIKGTVTAGPIQTVGTPASEVARLKSTGPLASRIGAALRAAPEETKRPGLGKVTAREIERQHPWSLGRGVAEMALTGGVENVMPTAGEAVESRDLERLAQSGVDVSKHANLLAAANLAGFLGGGLPLGAGVGKLPKAVTAGQRLARIAGASGRGAATMGTLAGEGALLERQDPKTALRNIATGAATGAALGGIMAPETRAVAGEVAELAGRGMASSATKAGGRPLTGSVRKGAVPVSGERVGAFGDLQRQGPFTAAHQLEIGKVRAAEQAPGEAPDLLPAMQRETSPQPTTGQRVGAIGDVSRFPEPKAARAEGTPVENVPTMAEQQSRMFKPGDFELSPEGRAEFDAIMGPVGTKTRVTWADAEELAKTIGTDPQKILRNVRDLSGEEILALKQGVAQNIARIETLSKVANDPAATAADKLAALGEIDRRMTDVSSMAARVTKETSQTGRDLNLMKVMGLNTMDPAVWTIQAGKIKGMPLTAEETLAITRAAGERDREELARIVSGLRTLTPWEKVVTVWKAGLLTNPKTHLVNVAGNTVMAGMELAKDVPAVVPDMMMGLATGRRTKALPSLSSVASAARQIRGPGWQAARTVARTGMSPADLQKWDFRNGRFGKTLGSARVGRWLDFYTQTVFRSLSAEDQLFKAAAIGRSLDEQIRVEAARIIKASRKAGKPISYTKAAAALRANVPDYMQAEAMADADFATFNSDNLLADAVQAGKGALKRVGGGGAAAVAESQLPFVRTPTNVLARTLDYTPAGVLRAFRPAIKMLQGHDLDANQKKVAEAFGRASLGSLILYLGFDAARNGKATGTIPLGAKDEWDVRGRMAGSVKVGDDWHNVVRMQPGGTLFALGAQAANIFENAQSGSDVAGGLAAATGKVVTDQPFLQGVTRVTEALQEPERRGGAWVRSMAGSVVPAVVGAVARGTNMPEGSDSPVQSDPKTVAEAIKARIPGLSRSVPTKLDVFGQPLPAQGVAGQLFDVTNTSRDRETPALREARRLGVNLTKPSRTISVAGKTYALSPEEYRLVQQQVGPEVLRRLEAALNLPGYQKERATPERTDLAQRERLESAIRTAKATVAKQLSRQIYRAEQQGAEHVGTLRPRRPKF